MCARCLRRHAGLAGARHRACQSEQRHRSAGVRYGAVTEAVSVRHSGRGAKFTPARRRDTAQCGSDGARASTKTIADFRKNTTTALQAANRDFVLMCHEMALLGGNRVAIDGTYMQADANRSRFHTNVTLERDAKIAADA